MIALIQRVTQARVDVDNETVAAIGPGMLALVAVQPDDSPARADRLLDRLLGYRIFEDHSGRMNRSLTDTAGALLLVSQFTLAADTRQGMRAGFATAAPPDLGRQLFEHLAAAARTRHAVVAVGRFGAHMQVTLTNDGPVTFWLQA